MLQLDRYFFTATQIISNPDYSDECSDDVRDFNISANARYSIEEDGIKLFVAAEVNNEADGEGVIFTNETAYNIATQVIGHFDVKKHENINDDIINSIAYNAAQLLIGVIRDHIFSVTAKSAWGPSYLPAIYLDKDSFSVEKDE